LGIPALLVVGESSFVFVRLFRSCSVVIRHGVLLIGCVVVGSVIAGSNVVVVVIAVGRLLCCLRALVF